LKDMKMINAKSFFSFISILCLVFIVNAGFSRGELLSKTYDWNFNVNNKARVRLKNYDCDINIESSSTGKVIFEIIIEAESGNQEDLDILDSYLKSLSFNSKPDLVNLETVFWDSRNKNGLNENNSIRIKLKNGETIKLIEFNISANLQIPKSSHLDLTSKYSKIQMDDIRMLDLDSYDDDIFGANVSGETAISAKYTDFEFDTFGKVEFDLYDCNIKAKKAGDMDLDSKYSDIQIENIGDLNIESYDDNFIFKSTGAVKLNTKYSDFKSEISGNMILNIYDSNFDIEKIGNLDISESKYSEYKIEEAGIVRIATSYDDNFLIDNLVSVKVDNTKYSDFVHQKADAFFELSESYDDNIKIHDTSPAFKHLEVEGKYGDILLETADGLPLKIDWNTKYGKIDLDEDDFKTTIKIKENSNIEYRGVRGKETENMPYVKVRGHNMKMNVR